MIIDGLINDFINFGYIYIYVPIYIYIYPYTFWINGLNLGLGDSWF